MAAGDEVVLDLRATFLREVGEALFSFAVQSESGQLVYHKSTFLREHRRFAAGESAIFRVRVPLNVTTGSYTARLGVAWGQGSDKRLTAKPLSFYVAGRPGARGVADLQARSFDRRRRDRHTGSAGR